MKPSLFYILLLGAVLFSCGKDSDPKGNLWIQVNNKLGAPVENATITSVPETSIGITGKDGTTIINDIPAGKYQFTATHPIYGTKTQNGEIIGGKTTLIDFFLEPEKIQYPPVVLEPIEINNTQIQIKWTKSTSPLFVSYQLEHSISSTNKFQIVQEFYSAEDTLYFQFINPLTENYYRIVTTYVNGDTTQSNLQYAQLKLKYLITNKTITKLKVDNSRPYLYALNTTDNTLDIINKNSMALEKSIFVGSQPSDLDISPDNSSMYIANKGSNQITLVDLNAQVKVKDFTVPSPGFNSFPSKIISLSANRILYAGESPTNLMMMDVNSGSIVYDTGTYYQPNFITNKDKSNLFIIDYNGILSKFKISTDKITFLKNNQLIGGNWNSKICLDENNNFLFYSIYKYDFNNLNSVLGSIPESIYSCSKDGAYVSGSNYIWYANTFTLHIPLPFQATLAEFDSDSNKIFVNSQPSSIIYSMEY